MSYAGTILYAKKKQIMSDDLVKVPRPMAKEIGASGGRPYAGVQGHQMIFSHGVKRPPRRRIKELEMYPATPMLIMPMTIAG